jgi:hypothetical protein
MKYLQAVALAAITGLLYTFIYVLWRETGIRPKGMESLYTAVVDIVSASVCALLAWLIVNQIVKLDKKRENK